MSFHELTKERPRDMAEIVACSYNPQIDRAENHLCRYRLYFAEPFEVIDGERVAPWFYQNIFGWEDGNALA